VSTVEERLARIEATQKAQNERLDKIVGLMERTVRLEERYDRYFDTIKRFGKRLDTLDARLTKIEFEDNRTKCSLSWIERLFWFFLAAVAGSNQFWANIMGG